MLINLTNHPYAKWMDDQKNSAENLYGEVRDMPFPAVPTDAGSDEIVAMAEECVCRVFDLMNENRAAYGCLSEGENTQAAAHAFAVMVQGEFTLTYAIVNRLKAAGLTVISSVSDRIVTEQKENGVIRKTAIFRFAGFREYV